MSYLVEVRVEHGGAGNQFFDAGYVFAPHVPLTQTPMILSPDSLEHRRGILQRYGRTLLEEGGLYYGRIVIHSTDPVTSNPFSVYRHMDIGVKVDWKREGF